MAQWRSGPHDDWPEGLGTALRLLRSAADAWSLQREAAPTVEQVLAIVIRALRHPLQAGEMPLALRSCIDRVRTPAIECGWLRCGQAPGRVPVAVAELREALASAARQWAAGDPEDPPTERVLLALASILFKH